MRELYIEGVAIRGGPESCVRGREAVGEWRLILMSHNITKLHRHHAH
ncbi:MAG TPA: hypothetical protein VG294_07660 [Solirubrobacteraceae bacterium]|jgi:hypothetical protein|nr:hypothetical protein [Solirubrobacteraceae bacterium]